MAHEATLIPGDGTGLELRGVGLAPGASSGTEAAMFEATHGSASKYKGQNKVNPTDLKPTRDDPSAVGTSEFADAVIEEMN